MIQDAGMIEWWALAASGVLWLLSWTMALGIVRERRPPAATLAWVALLVLLPVFGLLLYLLIGARKLPRRTHRPCQPELALEAVVPEAQADALDRMLRRFGIPPATRGNALRITMAPEQARADLLDVIGAAQQRLWVLMYSFEGDASGRAVLGELTAAARRGVDVRLMVDDLGSFGQLGSIRREFEASGGRIVHFKPVWYALTRRIANLRNHRKIVVADGALAWTGGRNVGDVYLDPKAGHWLDLSAVVRGPVVAVMEEICRGDWQFGSGDATCPAPGTAIANAGDATLQMLPSGPEHRDDLWQVSLIKACFEAQSRLWLATPYFVPDETVMNALLTAARSGVDVRILVPTRSDNLLVDFVARSYLREIQRSGVGVYRYDHGMMHAKVVLVDRSLGMFGSANIDARSLFLNYESTLIGYDEATIAPLEQFFAAAFARAKRGLRPTGRIRETLMSLARLAAPLL